MTQLKWILILAGAAFSWTAWPFPWTCNSYPDRNVVLIHGVIGDDGVIPQCPAGSMDPKKPITFILSSRGGNIDQINALVADLKTTFQNVFAFSNLVPTVIVANRCESACIPVLAALNEMADQNLIRLIIDRDTILGFHGCSDHDKLDGVEGHFSTAGTERYLNYWLQFGGNEAWITDHHAQFFESPVIHEMGPEDPRVSGSGLLNHAEIRSRSEWFNDRQNMAGLAAAH